MRVKINNLPVFGANKGGRRFTYSYLQGQRLPSNVAVVDPKGDRAKKLADLWSNRGVNATGYAERCEDMVKEIPRDSICMLSIDDLLSMVKVIEETDVRMVWQILGRSNRDLVFGFSGTLNSEDENPRASSILFLRDLSPYAASVSSEIIRESILNDGILADTRAKVSEYSADSVVRLAENPKASELRLFFGTENFPLVVVKGEIEPFRDIERRALEVEHPQINEAKDYAVAVVLTNQVDTFVIQRDQRRKRIRFYTSFGQPVISESESGQTVPTVVTD
jgi:hypothetical protein